MARLVWLTLGLALLSTAARAQTPSFRVDSASLLSPAQAAQYYGSGTSHTEGLCAFSPSRCVAPAPQMEALARSLSRDQTLPQEKFAQNAADYVRKNIDVEFRYGLSKGGLGALLDQSGTPFDQAELLVQILRLGGVAATYQFGQIELSPAQFQAWTGLTDARAACRLLADGGIPAEINNATLSDCAYSGPVTKVVISHLWVAAGGKLYDPSYKVHIKKLGIDLPAAMGCGSASASTCGAEARAAATPSGTYGYDAAAQANYVQNISETGLAGVLTTKASNLQAYIQSNLPTAQIEDVIGGLVVDINTDVVGAATLAYATTATQTWSKIPDQYRSLVSFHIYSSDYTFYADETQRYEIIVSSTPDYVNFSQPVTVSLRDTLVLHEDGDIIVGMPPMTAAGTSGQLISLIVSINHPYAAQNGQYMDESISKMLETWPPNATGQTPIFPFAIFNRFGSNRSASQPAAIVSVTVPIYAPTYSAWMAQASHATAITDAVANTRTTHHHTLGTILSLYYANNLTDANTAVSVTSLANSDADRKASILTTAAAFALTEGSVYRQQLDTAADDSAISLFHWSNLKGTRFYEATRQNVQSVLAQTTNYGVVAGVDEKTFVRGYLTSATTEFGAIVAKNGDTGVFGSSGTMLGSTNIIIAPLLAYTADASQTAYVTTYRNKSGGGQTAIVDPSSANPTAVSQERLFKLGVNGATGAAKIDFRPDITTGNGAFPRSLSLQRTMLNGPGVGGAINGYALYQNNDIQAAFANDAFEALGADSALDAAAAITAIHTLRDLNNNPDLRGRIAGVFTAGWLGDQFSGNVVVVTRGPDKSKFMRLPSGRFNPPNGSAERLVQTGARVPYPSFYGFKHTYSAVGFELTKEDGSNLHFEWAKCGARNTFNMQIDRNCYAITKWSFPDGAWVKYDYEDHYFVSPQSDLVYLPPAQLKSVVNSHGRSLTWQYVYDFSTSASIDPTISDDGGRSVKLQTVGFDQTNLPANIFRTGLRVTGVDGAVTGFYQEHDLNNLFADPVRVLYNADGTTAGTIALDGVGRVKIAYDGNGAATKYYPGAVTGSERAVVGASSDPLGAVTEKSYNRDAQVTRSVDALGRTSQTVYDGLGRMIRTTAPEGDSEERGYDVRSNVISVTRHAKSGSGLPDVVTTAEYGEGQAVWVCANAVMCNKPIVEIDARGKITNYSWDTSSGLLQQLLRPADDAGIRPQVDFTYADYASSDGSTFKLMSSVTEKVSSNQSLVSQYAYDSSNKFTLHSTTRDANGLGLVESYTYNAYGDLTSSDGPRTDVADVKTFVWDVARRLTMSVGADPDGAGAKKRRVEKYGYSADGLWVRADLGVAGLASGDDFVTSQTTLFRYDGMGNRTQAYVNAGTSAATLTQTSYDAAGRAVCVATRLNPTLFEGAYNASDRPDACALTVSGSFGPDRIAKTDYDAAGQASRVIQAFGTADQRDYATYSYNANGKQATIEDARYNRTTLRYDGFDRLCRQEFPVTTPGGHASNGPPAPQGQAYLGCRSTLAQAQAPMTGDFEEYGYDANGNQVWKRKRDNGGLTYSYDGLGRQTSKSGDRIAAVTSSFDLTGKPKSILFTSTGLGVTYGYDGLGRLTSETSFGRTLTYGYDQKANRTRVTWPDENSVAYDFDAADQLKSVTAGAASVTYDYDDLGRRTNAGGPGATKTWTYDPTGRLKAWTLDLAGADRDQTVTLDRNPDDQVVAESQGNAAYAWNSEASNLAATADGLNRDQVLVTNRGAGCAPIGKAYDCNGNLTDDGSRTSAYDGENRLTSVALPGASGTLDYDPLGRLRQTTINGQVTQFLYDGDRLVAEYDGAGNLLRRYAHGPGVDEPLVWFEGAGLGDIRYLHTDRLGSVIGWSNASGVSQAVYAYGPYGEPGDHWASGSRFRYTGQIALPELKLYHYKARAYDPARGWFLQTDPVGYKDDLNLYAYTGNDPINHTDPTGTELGAAFAADFKAMGGKPSPYNAKVEAYLETQWEYRFMRDGYIFLVTAPFYELGGAVVTEMVIARIGVWGLGWGARGMEIEKMLGGNLPPFFPTIDAMNPGRTVITSIKSLDLRAVTYRNAARLTKQLERYVDKLASLRQVRWRGETMVFDGKVVRVLTVAVPRGTIAASRAELVAARQAAASKGVILQIVEIY